MDQKQNHVQIQTACLLTLTIILVAAALYWLRPALIPFIFALFLTLTLSPIIDLQVRYLKAPRIIAIMTTFIFGILILSLLVLLLSASAVKIISNADSYQQNIQQLIDQASQLIPFKDLGLQPSELITPLLGKISNYVGSFIKAIIATFMGAISDSILISIFTLFLLLSKRRAKKHTPKILLDGESKIKRFLMTKSLVSILLGILTAFVLWVLNIKMALVFGLFACILNFIPSIGPLIATFLPLPVVLFTPGMTLPLGILAIALPGAMQFICGNFIETKLLGESLDIHPVTVLMSLIFWGMLWGIPGMFLAVPLTGIIKMIFAQMDATRPVAELFAGRLETNSHN